MMDRARDWPVRLELDPTAWIAPGAVVVGEVRLGPRSSVWFQSVVRGDSAAVEVGEESNIQDGTVVHQDEGMPARIGARVTIGHRAVVHGCTIEDECLIGMGAILLTGARIGTGSLIAAGALVREGQEIPPGSLVVGLPARVVGSTGPRHHEAIANGWRHYSELARSYLRRGVGCPHPGAWDAAGSSLPGRPPMSRIEWESLTGTLAASPAWAERKLATHGEPTWRERPSADRWCALEVLAHLRDSDAEVLLPRLERMIAEDLPEVANVDLAGWDRSRDYRSLSVPQVLASWKETRARAVRQLADLGPAEWRRMAIHWVRGPLSIAELVRGWVEHDLTHRRQLARALGEPS